MKTHLLTLFLASTMPASSATFTQTRQITLEIDGNDPELYGESADTSVPKFPPWVANLQASSSPSGEIGVTLITFKTA